MTLDIFFVYVRGANRWILFIIKSIFKKHAKLMINFSWGTWTKWEKIENLYMYSWLYHITWNVYIIVNELITTLFSFELAAGCVIARNRHISVTISIWLCNLTKKRETKMNESIGEHFSTTDNHGCVVT